MTPVRARAASRLFAPSGNSDQCLDFFLARRCEWPLPRRGDVVAGLVPDELGTDTVEDGIGEMDPNGGVAELEDPVLSVVGADFDPFAERALDGGGWIR